MATAIPFGGNELIGEGKDERCKKFGAFHFLYAFFIFFLEGNKKNEIDI